LRDDSPRHTSHKKAHPEASTPGGHYSLFIVSESFQGLSRLDRERSVVEILRPLFNTNEIHALQMTLRAPSEIT
jgi:BolA protein